MGHEYKKILDTTKKTSLDVKIIYQIFGNPLHDEFLTGGAPLGRAYVYLKPGRQPGAKTLVIVIVRMFEVTSPAEWKSLPEPI